MKSLILKDLYNIGNNARSMLFTLLVFLFIFTSYSGVGSYIVMCAMLCGQMVVTTFSFDDMAGWNRYALVTPVSRRDLVAGKFIVLLIFSALGAGFGLAAAAVYGTIVGKVVLDLESIMELLFFALTALVMGVFFGSTILPLLFKFGAEKARIAILAVFAVLAIVCVAAGLLLRRMGVQITDRSEYILMCFFPAITVVWSLGMYKLSCAIFSKQEV